VAGDTDPLVPANLDHALGWLERNLDDLTDAARRQGDLIRQQTAPLAPPAASAGAPALPSAVDRLAAMGPNAARQVGDSPQPTAGSVPSSQAAPSATNVTPEAALAAFESLRAAAARGSAGSLPAGGSSAAPDSAVPGAGASAAAQATGQAPVSAAVPPTPTPDTTATVSATPLLDSLGRDLTALAARGELTPIIGRQAELESVIEILCRSTKRNPVLLGPAGSGKTAIVEGLAQRIAAGDVPTMLEGTRIVEIPLASLVAGTSYRGQLEERLQALVKEASHPGIVLFFDEIHLLAGAGRSDGGMGADQVFKPALARGDIAVIGATTPDEYHATIEQDDALARRFTTLVIHELTSDETRPILQAVRDQLAKSRGVRVDDDALDVLLDFAEKRIANRRFPDKAIDLLEQTVAEAIVAGRATVSKDDAVTTTQVWETRASSTPTLDRFGRNLVALAKAGSLTPIVGRDRELDAVTEILLRQTKRNPLLLGPAGSGKTAIVEGLAERIASGDVPAALAEIRIFDVPIASLAGAIERDPDRLRDLLAEARHPSVVVFFDEIHQLAAPGSRVLSESLKPALARGDIACIGATTGAEFQAYIEPEAALARRFSLVQVDPMDDAAVRKVLVAVRDNLARKRGVHVSDGALDDLIDIADAYMPGRSFPDKGVDLVEQAVVYGLVHNLTEVDPATARQSSAAFLGLNLDPTDALAALKDAVDRQALLATDAAAALMARLGVTLRGLDARSERPDAVALLAGAAAATAERLASACAAALFGRTTALISIDLSPMTEDSSISTLLGSAPGLVGSDRTLPIHELRRSPRQVLLLTGIDRCAATIRQTVGAALASGFFTDAMGRTVPLSSAVVVLTAPDLPVAATDLQGLLGPDLVGTCDVVATDAPSPLAAAGQGGSDWITSELLEPLARRFARSGITVTFDASFEEWLKARLAAPTDSPEAFLDRVVTPALIASLPSAATGSYVATVDADKPLLRPAAPAS
jgi:ATP-dependent Clp protease ATP-binding subunit ClpC